MLNRTNKNQECPLNSKTEGCFDLRVTLWFEGNRELHTLLPGSHHLPSLLHLHFKKAERAVATPENLIHVQEVNLSQSQPCCFGIQKHSTQFNICL